MNKTTRALIVVVLILAAGAAIWYGVTHNTQIATNQPSPSASASPTPVVVPTLTYDAPPADWVTYASSALGFKVSHPKGWVIGSCGPDCVTFADPTSTNTPLVGINVSASGSLNDILTSAKPYIQASGSVDFNGIKWTRVVLQEPQTGSVFISHFAASGKKIFELGLGIINDANVKIYGEIVRSFSLAK